MQGKKRRSQLEYLYVGKTQPIEDFIKPTIITLKKCQTKKKQALKKQKTNNGMH